MDMAGWAEESEASEAGFRDGAAVLSEERVALPGDKWCPCSAAETIPEAGANCLLLPDSSLFSSSLLFKQAVFGFMLRSVQRGKEHKKAV